MDSRSLSRELSLITLGTIKDNQSFHSFDLKDNLEKTLETAIESITNHCKIELDNFKYEVPTFLISGEIPENIVEGSIKKSLLFTRSVLLNKFFLPNNLIFPKSRIIFENYFN